MSAQDEKPAALSTTPKQSPLPRNRSMSAIQEHISKNLPFYLFLVLAGALSLLGKGPIRLLEFDRNAILSGEYYRLITGHFVHLGPAHALMDLAAAILLWIWFRDALSLRGWLFSVLVCGLLISLMLLAFTDIQWYVGISGSLHGLLLLGTLRKKNFSLWIKALVLGLLALKIGVEQFHGASPKTVALIGGEVVTAAHLFGAIAGLLIWGGFNVINLKVCDSD
jgi:rhomboid family GlyGly-CTERM serine protease